jgi:hypothetical protein
MNQILDIFNHQFRLLENGKLQKCKRTSINAHTSLIRILVHLILPKGSFAQTQDGSWFNKAKPATKSLEGDDTQAFAKVRAREVILEFHSSV